MAQAAGDDANGGSSALPFKTISAAARRAQPGDTVLVHAGIYREQITPPRGVSDAAHRITYASAPGEKMVITGSDSAKGWIKEAGDTWKLTLPSKHFGAFNPFAETVHGDWFNPHFRVHRGGVWVNGISLVEAPSLAGVMAPVKGTPC